MKRILFLLLFLVSFVFGNAQCMAPYSDFNFFQYVFENGVSTKIEPLPLKGYKVGKEVFAYVHQNSRLKIYYQGRTYNACDVVPNYFTTDHLFVFQNLNSVKVLNDNKFQQIEFQFREGEDRLYVSDSLVVWTNPFREVNVFYNGETRKIDDINTMNAKISDNTYAYMDISNNFKVFYQGKVTVLESFEPEQFYVDRDIVAWLDYQSNYKFFYKGKIYESNINNVMRVFPCEKQFAYISRLNEFSVWREGEEVTLLNYVPPKFEVKENMIVYADKGNNFYCYYNGEKIWVERYIPTEWVIDNDILVYKDINGRLKAIYFGKEVEVSDQMVQKFTLYNETVVYSLQPYETKIWCAGKTYTYR